MSIRRFALIFGIVVLVVTVAAAVAFVAAGHYIVTEPGRMYTPAEWSAISQTRMTIQSIAGILVLALPSAFIQWIFVYWQEIKQGRG